jgi:hypothetical protein
MTKGITKVIPGTNINGDTYRHRDGMRTGELPNFFIGAHSPWKE